jgi:aldose 1-epimerase
VLFGYAVSEMCGSGRGQVLVPWPNRLDGGRYDFDGRSHQLAVDELAHNNAIHGLVRWASWRVREQAPARVVVEHVLHPLPGYPFALALAIEYALSDLGLSVRTTATNVGDDACPYGAGAHPYLTVADTVDDVLLNFAGTGRTVLRSDERGLPTGTEAVEHTEYDFRKPRQISSITLDHAFTDLARDADGRMRVELQGPGGRGATLWADGHYPYVQIFTGDLPDIGRRGLAVEAMTCPANAFRTGEALLRLEPGESVTGAWGITPTPIGSGPVSFLQPPRACGPRLQSPVEDRPRLARRDRHTGMAPTRRGRRRSAASPTRTQRCLS